MSALIDNAWSQLEAELNAWAAESQTATFWWRDDDAIQAGEKLQHLIDITTDTGLLLAVIPASMKSSLAKMLTDCSHVKVAQHGYAHINHAPRGQGLGAWELGLHRGEDAVMSDLAVGRSLLEEHFDTDFIQVIVPPWNRIAPGLLMPVAARGYRGVSAFGLQNADDLDVDMVVANAHCDPIRWKSGAQFTGTGKAVSQLVSHLQARRTGSIAINQHTGFLTHHIDMDNECWEFCNTLISLVSSHDAARWVSPLSIFDCQA